MTDRCDELDCKEWAHAVVEETGVKLCRDHARAFSHDEKVYLHEWNDGSPAQYVRVQSVHPDWKDGECRECGKHLPDRIHRDVKRGQDPAKTTCPDCNRAYDPLEMNTVGRGPSVPEIAVNQRGVTERL